MQQSSRRTPCPSCGRTRDGDCRWNAGAIWCHQGSHNGPDPELRVGDVIDIDGKPWALVSRNAGFAGSAALFRPHRGKQLRSRRYLPKRLQKAVEVVSDLHNLEADLMAFDRLALAALGIPPLDQMLDSNIKEALNDCVIAIEAAKPLICRVNRIGQTDHRYLQLADQLTDTARDLRYQHADLTRYCSNPAAYWQAFLLEAA